MHLISTMGQSLVTLILAAADAAGGMDAIERRRSGSSEAGRAIQARFPRSAGGGRVLGATRLLGDGRRHATGPLDRAADTISTTSVPAGTRAGLHVHDFIDQCISF